VGGDLEAGCVRHFGLELTEETDFGIDDAVALGADQVRMGIRLSAVVAVAAVGEGDFQNFADFFEQVDGLVDRGEACGREIDFDLVKNLFNAWVLVGVEKSLQDGNPLGGDAAVPLPEFAEDFIKTFLRIYHLGTVNLRSLLWIIIINRQSQRQQEMSSFLRGRGGGVDYLLSVSFLLNPSLINSLSYSSFMLKRRSCNLILLV